MRTTRRHPGVALALAAALMGLSAGFAASATQAASPSVGAIPKGDARGACPAGHRPVGSHPALGPLCTHEALDMLPDPPGAAAATNGSAPPMAPTCHGNGVSGNRVELLYVFEDGAPDRSPELSPLMLGQIVPAMEGLIRARSKEQGMELGLRLHMPDCELSLEPVPLSKAALAPEPDVITQFGRIVDELASLGFDHSDRKYLVWVDGLPAVDSRPGSPFGDRGPCGAANGGLLDSRPLPNPFDQPTPTNYHDGLVPMYAVVFSSPAWYYPETPCWGAGDSGAEIETHELFHTLGAVQLSAMNSNGFGHCTDGPDILCYPEFGQKVENRCFQSTVKLLDCNGDDYFNVNPPAGSYLETHWNTARSSFLGPAIIDAVPVELRRP